MTTREVTRRHTDTSDESLDVDDEMDNEDGDDEESEMESEGDNDDDGPRVNVQLARGKLLVHLQRPAASMAGETSALAAKRVEVSVALVERSREDVDWRHGTAEHGSTMRAWVHRAIHECVQRLPMLDMDVRAEGCSVRVEQSEPMDAEAESDVRDAERKRILNRADQEIARMLFGDGDGSNARRPSPSWRWWLHAAQYVFRRIRATALETTMHCGAFELCIDTMTLTVTSARACEDSLPAEYDSARDRSSRPSESETSEGSSLASSVGMNMSVVGLSLAVNGVHDDEEVRSRVIKRWGMIMRTSLEVPSLPSVPSCRTSVKQEQEQEQEDIDEREAAFTRIIAGQFATVGIAQGGRSGSLSRENRSAVAAAAASLASAPTLRIRIDANPVSACVSRHDLEVALDAADAWNTADVYSGIRRCRPREAVRFSPVAWWRWTVSSTLAITRRRRVTTTASARRKDRGVIFEGSAPWIPSMKWSRLSVLQRRRSCREAYMTLYADKLVHEFMHERGTVSRWTRSQLRTRNSAKLESLERTLEIYDIILFRLLAVHTSRALLSLLDARRRLYPERDSAMMRNDAIVAVAYNGVLDAVQRRVQPLGVLVESCRVPMVTVEYSSGDAVATPMRVTHEDEREGIRAVVVAAKGFGGGLVLAPGGSGGDSCSMWMSVDGMRVSERHVRCNNVTVAESHILESGSFALDMSDTGGVKPLFWVVGAMKADSMLEGRSTQTRSSSPHQEQYQQQHQQGGYGFVYGSPCFVVDAKITSALDVRLGVDQVARHVVAARGIGSGRSKHGVASRSFPPAFLHALRRISADNVIERGRIPLIGRRGASVRIEAPGARVFLAAANRAEMRTVGDKQQALDVVAFEVADMCVTSVTGGDDECFLPEMCVARGMSGDNECVRYPSARLQNEGAYRTSRIQVTAAAYSWRGDPFADSTVSCRHFIERPTLLGTRAVRAPDLTILDPLRVLTSVASRSGLFDRDYAHVHVRTDVARVRLSPSALRVAESLACPLMERMCAHDRGAGVADTLDGDDEPFPRHHEETTPSQSPTSDGSDSIDGGKRTVSFISSTMSWTESNVYVELPCASLACFSQDIQSSDQARESRPALEVCARGVDLLMSSRLSLPYSSSGVECGSLSRFSAMRRLLNECLFRSNRREVRPLDTRDQSMTIACTNFVILDTRGHVPGADALALLSITSMPRERASSPDVAAQPPPSSQSRATSRTESSAAASNGMSDDVSSSASVAAATTTIQIPLSEYGGSGGVTPLTCHPDNRHNSPAKAGNIWGGDAEKAYMSEPRMRCENEWGDPLFWCGSSSSGGDNAGGDHRRRHEALRFVVRQTRRRSSTRIQCGRVDIAFDIAPISQLALSPAVLAPIERIIRSSAHGQLSSDHERPVRVSEADTAEIEFAQIRAVLFDDGDDDRAQVQAVSEGHHSEAWRAIVHAVNAGDIPPGSVRVGFENVRIKTSADVRSAAALHIFGDGVFVDETISAMPRHAAEYVAGAGYGVDANDTSDTGAFGVRRIVDVRPMSAALGADQESRHSGAHNTRSESNAGAAFSISSSSEAGDPHMSATTVEVVVYGLTRILFVRPVLDFVEGLTLKMRAQLTSFMAAHAAERVRVCNDRRVSGVSRGGGGESTEGVRRTTSTPLSSPHLFVYFRLNGVSVIVPRSPTRRRCDVVVFRSDKVYMTNKRLPAWYGDAISSSARGDRGGSGAMSIYFAECVFSTRDEGSESGERTIFVAPSLEGTLCVQTSAVTVHLYLNSIDVSLTSTAFAAVMGAVFEHYLVRAPVAGESTAERASGLVYDVTIKVARARASVFGWIDGLPESTVLLMASSLLMHVTYGGETDTTGTASKLMRVRAASSSLLIQQQPHARRARHRGDGVGGGDSNDVGDAPDHPETTTTSSSGKVNLVDIFHTCSEYGIPASSNSSRDGGAFPEGDRAWTATTDSHPFVMEHTLLVNGDQETRFDISFVKSVWPTLLDLSPLWSLISVFTDYFSTPSYVSTILRRGASARSGGGDGHEAVSKISLSFGHLELFFPCGGRKAGGLATDEGWRYGLAIHGSNSSLSYSWNRPGSEAALLVTLREICGHVKQDDESARVLLCEPVPIAVTGVRGGSSGTDTREQDISEECGIVYEHRVTDFADVEDAIRVSGVSLEMPISGIPVLRAFCDRVTASFDDVSGGDASDMSSPTTSSGAASGGSPGVDEDGNDIGGSREMGSRSMSGLSPTERRSASARARGREQMLLRSETNVLDFSVSHELGQDGDDAARDSDDDVDNDDEDMKTRRIVRAIVAAAFARVRRTHAEDDSDVDSYFEGSSAADDEYYDDRTEGEQALDTGRDSVSLGRSSHCVLDDDMQSETESGGAAAPWRYCIRYSVESFTVIFVDDVRRGAGAAALTGRSVVSGGRGVVFHESDSRVPVLRVSVPELHGDYLAADSCAADVEVSLRAGVDYWNAEIERFEYLVAQWGVSVKYAQRDFSSVSVTSDERMSIVLTPSQVRCMYRLPVFLQAWELEPGAYVQSGRRRWKDAVSKNGGDAAYRSRSAPHHTVHRHQERDRQGPCVDTNYTMPRASYSTARDATGAGGYVVRNDTGVRMWFWFAGTNATMLGAGRERNISLEKVPRSTHRIGSGGGNGGGERILHVQMDGGWKPLRIAALSRVGRYAIVAETLLGNIKLPLIAEVTRRGREHVLSLHSSLRIVNETQRHIDFRFLELHEGVAACNLPRLFGPVLAGGGSMYVPLPAVLHARMSMRAVGYEFMEGSIELSLNQKDLIGLQGVFSCPSTTEVVVGGTYAGSNASISSGGGGEGNESASVMHSFHMALQVEEFARVVSVGADDGNMSMSMGIGTKSEGMYDLIFSCPLVLVNLLPQPYSLELCIDLDDENVSANEQVASEMGSLAPSVSSGHQRKPSENRPTATLPQSSALNVRSMSYREARRIASGAVNHRKSQSFDDELSSMRRSLSLRNSLVREKDIEEDDEKSSDDEEDDNEHDNARGISGDADRTVGDSDTINDMCDADETVDEGPGGSRQGGLTHRVSGLPSFRQRFADVVSLAARDRSHASAATSSRMPMSGRTTDELIRPGRSRHIYAVNTRSAPVRLSVRLGIPGVGSLRFASSRALHYFDLRGDLEASVPKPKKVHLWLESVGPHSVQSSLSKKLTLLVEVKASRSGSLSGSMSFYSPFLVYNLTPSPILFRASGFGLSNAMMSKTVVEAPQMRMGAGGKWIAQPATLFFSKRKKLKVRTSDSDWSRNVDLNKVGLDGTLRLDGGYTGADVRSDGNLDDDAGGIFSRKMLKVPGSGPGNRQSFYQHILGVTLRYGPGEMRRSELVIVSPAFILSNRSGRVLEIKQVVSDDEPGTTGGGGSSSSGGSAGRGHDSKTGVSGKLSDGGVLPLMSTAYRPGDSSASDLKFIVRYREVRLRLDNLLFDGVTTGDQNAASTSDAVSIDNGGESAIEEAWWQWSYPFRINEAGEQILRMKGVDGTDTTHLIPVYVSVKGASTLVIFGKEEDAIAPYRIENSSTSVTMHVVQKGMGSEVPWETIAPGSSLDYAWDAPLKPHRLKVCMEHRRVQGVFFSRVIKEYSLDEIQSRPTIKFKSNLAADASSTSAQGVTTIRSAAAVVGGSMHGGSLRVASAVRRKSSSKGNPLESRKRGDHRGGGIGGGVTGGGQGGGGGGGGGAQTQMVLGEELHVHIRADGPFRVLSFTTGQKDEKVTRDLVVAKRRLRELERKIAAIDALIDSVDVDDMSEIDAMHALTARSHSPLQSSVGGVGSTIARGVSNPSTARSEYGNPGSSARLFRVTPAAAMLRSAKAYLTQRGGPQQQASERSMIMAQTSVGGRGGATEALTSRAQQWAYGASNLSASGLDHREGGELLVHLIRGIDVGAGEIEPDALFTYCRISLDDQVRMTPTLAGTSEPEWEHRCIFSGATTEACLLIEVYNQGAAGDEVLLGEARVYIEDEEVDGEELSLSLKMPGMSEREPFRRRHGSIAVALSWHRTQQEKLAALIKAREQELAVKEHVLNIVDEELSDLPNGAGIGAGGVVQGVSMRPMSTSTRLHTVACTNARDSTAIEGGHVDGPHPVAPHGPVARKGRTWGDMEANRHAGGGGDIYGEDESSQRLKLDVTIFSARNIRARNIGAGLYVRYSVLGVVVDDRGTEWGDHRGKLKKRKRKYRSVHGRRATPTARLTGDGADHHRDVGASKERTKQTAHRRSDLPLRTGVVRGTKSPEWNEGGSFHGVTSKSRLRVEVVSRNIRVGDRVLGAAELPFEGISSGRHPQFFWLPLAPCGAEALRGSLSALMFTGATQPAEKQTHVGDVRVRVEFSAPETDREDGGGTSKGGDGGGVHGDGGKKLSSSDALTRVGNERASSSTRVRVQLHGIGIGIQELWDRDRQVAELLHLYFGGALAEWERGGGDEGEDDSVRLMVSHLQVDNMMLNAEFPVMLSQTQTTTAAAAAAAAAAATATESESNTGSAGGAKGGTNDMGGASESPGRAALELAWVRTSNELSRHHFRYLSVLLQEADMHIEEALLDKMATLVDDIHVELGRWGERRGDQGTTTFMPVIRGGRGGAGVNTFSVEEEADGTAAAAAADEGSRSLAATTTTVGVGVLESVIFNPLDYASSAPAPSTSSEAKLYFDLLHLHPIKLNVNVYSHSGDDASPHLGRWLSGGRGGSSNRARLRFSSATGIPVINLRGAPLHLDSLLMEHVYLDGGELVLRLAAHYRRQVLQEIYKLIGSVEFLGAPTSLVSNLGTGVISLFYEPAKGIMQSPQDFGKGLATGTSSFVKLSVYAVFNTFSTVTGSAAKGLQSVANDPHFRWAHQQTARRGGRAAARQMVHEHPGRGQLHNIRTSLLDGVRDLGSGVLGLADIVMKPIEGAQMDGAKGFVFGLGTGAVGSLVKPVAGFLQLVSRTTGGVRELTELDRAKPMARIRTPRIVPPQGAPEKDEWTGEEWTGMGPYSSRQFTPSASSASMSSLGGGIDILGTRMTHTRFLVVDLLTKIRGGKYASDELVDFFIVGAKVLLVTDNRFVYVHRISKKVDWAVAIDRIVRVGPHFEEIQVVCFAKNALGEKAWLRWKQQSAAAAAASTSSPSSSNTFESNRARSLHALDRFVLRTRCLWCPSSDLQSKILASLRDILRDAPAAERAAFVVEQRHARDGESLRSNAENASARHSGTRDDDDDDDTDDEGYATGDDDESSVDVPVPSLSHKKAKGKLKMRRAKRTVTFDLFDNENDTDGIDNDERDSLSEYSPDDLPIC